MNFGFSKFILKFMKYIACRTTVTSHEQNRDRSLRLRSGQAFPLRFDHDDNLNDEAALAADCWSRVTSHESRATRRESLVASQVFGRAANRISKNFRPTNALRRGDIIRSQS
jgi:hypothetical protein